MKIDKFLLHKLLFCMAFTAAFSGVFAQSSITSPYSRFGIGELAPQYNLRSSAMGGISQGITGTIGVNFANPASYAAFDSLSFLFDIAVTGNFTTLKSETEKDRSSTASINYITFGFPITKRWHTALGLIPISSVGYNIYNKVEADDYLYGKDFGNAYYIYTGDGSFNKAFWGNSFKILENLSVGLNIGYMFGNSNYLRSVTFDTIYALSPKIVNSIYVNGFTFEPALQYSLSLPNKDKITVGATYHIQSRIKAENDFWVRSLNIGPSPDSITRDVIEGHLKMPASLKAGFTYGRTGKFVAGADFYWTNWAQYNLFDLNDNLSNNWGVSIGGEIVPSNKPAAKYFQKTAYRVGFKTQQGLFEFDDEKINLYAVSLGMGLPLTRSKTMFNLYFEAGTKGKTIYPLVQENYFKIGAALSLYEMWFFKRQYR